VRWQLALTLGDVLATGNTRFHARVVPLLVRLLASAPGDATLCSVVGVAAHPHGLEVLREVQRGLPAADPERFDAVLQELARLVVRSRAAGQQQQLFTLVPACGAPWQRRALLRGAVTALPRGAGRAGWLPFDATPRELLELASGDDAECRRLANDLLAAVVLSGDASSPAAAELTDAERQRVQAGAKVYARACAACHQLDGVGLPGLAPPLSESDWVLGAPDRLMRIALHGVRGPIEVNGIGWNLDMPGQGHLSDEEIAQVLSYVRRSFGHRAGTVAPAEVGAIRAANKARKEPWTAPELLGTK
jgi:mono/diheme cytochrome c family protein